MRINFAQIWEGWRNLLIPPAEMKEQIKALAAERTAICEGCGFHSDNQMEANPLRPDKHCTECGCTISAKVSCLSCECPLPTPMWKAVLTDDEEIFLKTRDWEEEHAEGSGK